MAAVNVVAVIRSHAGKEKELEGLLTKLVVETHKEPGCLRYALHKSQSDPRSFIFVEKWASAQDLGSHLQSAHIAAAMSRKEELIEKLDISPLVPLAAGDKKKEEI